jgi:hypothetical protein
MHNCRSRSYSNQVNAKTIVKAKKKVMKAKANNKEAARGVAKNDIVPFDIAQQCPQEAK